MLSEPVKECLRHEINLHDGCHDIALCIHLMIVAACIISDTEMDEEAYDESRVFIVDEVMLSCILKGAVEPSHLDENGEMIFEVTDFGRSQLEKKSSSDGTGEQNSEEER